MTLVADIPIKPDEYSWNLYCEHVECILIAETCVWSPETWSQFPPASILICRWMLFYTSHGPRGTFDISFMWTTEKKKKEKGNGESKQKYPQCPSVNSPEVVHNCRALYLHTLDRRHTRSHSYNLFISHAQFLTPSFLLLTRTLNNIHLQHH